MNKKEFKDTLAKYEDIIKDLAEGLEYTDNKLAYSPSKCKENCHIALYDQDLYGATDAEWNDDGKVTIYIYEGKWNEYIPEHIFETTEELDFWLSHNYIDDNRWDISDDVIAKYRK